MSAAPSIPCHTSRLRWWWDNNSNVSWLESSVETDWDQSNMRDVPPRPLIIMWRTISLVIKTAELRSQPGDNVEFLAEQSHTSRGQIISEQWSAISDNIWDLSNTHVDVVSVVDAYNSQDQSFWNIFSWRCWGWLEWEWVGVIVLRQYYDNIWQGAHHYVWHDPPHWLLQGVHSEHCLQGVLIFLSQLLCGQ